jgi:hypothetical protein
MFFLENGIATAKDIVTPIAGKRQGNVAKLKAFRSFSPGVIMD